MGSILDIALLIDRGSNAQRPTPPTCIKIDECQGKGYRLFINRSQIPEPLKRPPRQGEGRGNHSVNGNGTAPSFNC